LNASDHASIPAPDQMALQDLDSSGLESWLQDLESSGLESWLQDWNLHFQGFRTWNLGAAEENSMFRVPI
jgi:hypothetical protein